MVKKKSIFEEYEILDDIEVNTNFIERKIKHLKNNIEGVVKIYKKEDFEKMPMVKQMMLNEYKCLSKLDHPNILKIRDMFEEPKYAFVVYDYIGKNNLRRYIERRDAIRENDAYYILLQVARAIAHAHERGICHRDIRPEIVKV
jgi:serine/threonine protein kinase